MNINHLLRQIAGKCRYLNRQLLICHYKRCLYQEVERNKGEKVVYLFSNPTHSNLGDQAQTVCILCAGLQPIFHNTKSFVYRWILLHPNS